MEIKPSSSAGAARPAPAGDSADDGPTLIAPVEQVLSGGATASSPAPSAGSSHDAMLAPDQQPTVISKQPPFVEKPAPLPSPRDLAQLMVGKQLDHFHLTEYVGGGGMGAVFKGTDTKLGRTVAVKILSRDLNDLETQRRFKNEAQSAARLDHENIARVYYVGEADGWPYIVFEFIEGVNLRDLVLERGPLELDEAISYTLQIAEALRHAASREVVHRDIKPSNVLITPAGKAKLVDMGLARQHQVDAPSHDLTASGVTLGTFDYISPEQARDPRSADVRSDIYSLGCTLYYILTGRPPFPEGTVLQKLISHSSDPPPDPRQFRADLPDELTAILDRMLAKQPDRRYPSPDDLISELWDLVDAAHLIVDAPTYAARPVVAEAELTLLERHLPWIVPSLLLVVLVFASDVAFPSSELADAPQPVFAVRPPPPVPARELPAAEIVPAAEEPASPPPAADPSEPLPAGTIPPAVPREPTVRVAEPPKVPIDSGELDPAARPVAPPSPRPAAPEAPPSELPGVAPDEAAVVPLPLGPAVPAIDPAAPILSTSPSSPNPTPPGAVPAVASAGPASGPRLVIVGDGPTASIPKFADLAAAAAFVSRRLAGAPLPEAVIELRYSGLRPTAPVTFANQKVTLRAGLGYAPRVAFVPNSDAQGRLRRSMVTIVGGEFVAENVHFEFAVPDAPADNWSLFELRRPEEVRFAQCTFTIQNAASGRLSLHPDVAFFDLRPPAVTEKMMLMADGAMTGDEAPTPLSLVNCAARGEATFVRATESLPLRFYWHNGLLASSERLLSLGGAEQASRLGGNIEVQLHHLTAVVARGLIQVNTSPNARHQLEITARCTDNIFLAPGRLPFVEQVGPDEVELQRKFLMYSGTGNFYQASFDEPMERFWRISATGANVTSTEMDFAQWNRQWPDETLPQRRIVKWIAPPAEAVPFHKFAKQDLLLRPERTNPARGSAEGNRDAGFEAETLPEFPGSGRAPPASSEPVEASPPIAIPPESSTPKGATPSLPPMPASFGPAPPPLPGGAVGPPAGRPLPAPPAAPRPDPLGELDDFSP